MFKIFYLLGLHAGEERREALSGLMARVSSLFCRKEITRGDEDEHPNGIRSSLNDSIIYAIMRIVLINGDAGTLVGPVAGLQEVLLRVSSSLSLALFLLLPLGCLHLLYRLIFWILFCFLFSTRVNFHAILIFINRLVQDAVIV